MTFTILTIIVFMSELIIANAVIAKLKAFDKALCEANTTVIELKPGIKDISYLAKKISAQLIEFAYDFDLKLKNKRDDSIVNILNKALITLLLLKINSKFINRLRRSRLLKRLKRGLSLLKYMI